jgi:hypothetical protein
VQQIAWRGVADGLDHALSDPRARRVRGDTDVDDPAALEGGDDEPVKGPEVDCDHREEVARPSLRRMVPEKGSPGLTAATLQVLWAVLRDRARRDAPAELRELAGNPVLAPQEVLSPHTPDEGPQLGIDRRPADWTARAATPPQSPSRSVPPENRHRSHDDHRLEQRARSGRQRRDQPSIWWAKARTRRRASEHGELMAKYEVLGCDESVRRQKSCEGSGHVAKEVDHRAIFRPVVQQVQPSRRLAQRRARRVSAAHRGSLRLNAFDRSVPPSAKP